MIDQQQTRRFVETVPLFHNFEHDQLDRVVSAMRCQEYSADQRLLEGDAEPSMAIVVQGEFRAALRQDELDLDVELSHYYPGDSFGDTALIAGRMPYSYVQAVSDGLLLHLDKPAFDQLMADSPWFASKVCQNLASRLLQAVDRFGSVPYVKLSDRSDLASHAHLLPARICKACKCLVIGRVGDRVRVGMVDPSDGYSRNFVASALRPWEVEWAAISHDQFDHYATQLLRARHTPASLLEEDARLQFISPSGERGDIARAGDSPMLIKLLHAAVSRGSSDLHLEPGHDAAGARMRVDGRMETIEEDITPHEMRAMVSQVKVMCELDIARTQLPMDGSFTLLAGDRRYEVRVSTLPCQGGEKAVLRLVSPHSHFSRLENLILAPGLNRLASQVFQSPNGLVLVTGPTGSGKTTTLYAALQSLWRENPAINVITIEDPIEYNLPFATQVQINPENGLTFANVLRSVMRQDPDVILVGEIRDPESAALAVGAATTGHLVLSSLHTHSALETLARLRQLNVKSYLLADALRGVVSQKLAPRLLPGAGVPVPADDPIVARLKQMHILPEEFKGQLRRAAEPENAPDGEPIASEQGRLGVYEVLAVTDHLRRLIESQAPMHKLEQSLRPGELVRFADYSRFLLQDGLVAPEQIERLFRQVDIAQAAELGELQRRDDAHVAAAPHHAADVSSINSAT